MLVEASRCAVFHAPAASQRCNTQPCAALSWQPQTLWSDCSSPCDNGTSSSLGVSIGSGAQCVATNAATGNTTVVDPSSCNAANISQPSAVRPCNRFSCPVPTAVWSAGPWGACTSLQTQQCGPGSRGRTVRCVLSDSGAVLPISRCASSGARPVSTETCVVAPCACAVDADCASVGLYNSYVCGSDGTCVCGPGWAGATCSIGTIPVTQPSDGGPVLTTCSGVVDVYGVCCTTGAVDSVTGGCCESGATVDAAGRCCNATAPVDACGVCGGGGVVVDVFGQCCSSSLPPSGQCCVSGNVDECGVCDGTNACSVTLTVILHPYPGTEWNTSSVDNGALAGVIGVSSSDVSNTTVGAYEPSGGSGYGQYGDDSGYYQPQQQEPSPPPHQPEVRVRLRLSVHVASVPQTVHANALGVVGCGVGTGDYRLHPQSDVVVAEFVCGDSGAERQRPWGAGREVCELVTGPCTTIGGYASRG